MANTPIYGWETPDDTDYVYQGAAAARTTANAIDTTLAAQVTTLNATINSTVAPYPQGIKSYQRSTTETFMVIQTLAVQHYRTAQLTQAA